MPLRMKLLITRGRGLTGAILLPVLLLVAGAGVARAGGEVVPSFGVTKSVDGNADAKMSGGLALRGHPLPLLMDEIGVGYRSESRYNDQLHLRQWPVTASLYLAPPTSIVYAGAGVGWYHSTYDYAEFTGIPSETKQQFGVHPGGGFQVPVGPSVGLDLSGRYVMLRDQQSHLVPQKFDPDFWTTSLGLAIKF
jgi:opacity protein-like surface antigen